MERGMGRPPVGRRRPGARRGGVAGGMLAGAAVVAILAMSGPVPVAGADTPPAPVVHPEAWPHIPSGRLLDPAVEARVTALLAKLSVEEKVGQLIQGDISTIKPEDLRRYPLGSILAGGNSGPDGDDRAPARAWLALADAFHAVAMEPRPGHTPIPLLFGVDAVHGHNNIVGATIFPHNIGLGAARDPDLIRRIAEVTGRELAATGVDWTFAPTVAVVRDDRWGRTYEGYSEDPEIVAAYAGVIVEALQGKLGTPGFMAPGRTVTSAKHYLGDGGTFEGRDQGDNRATEAELVRIHNAGYPPALEAGTLTVMASFSSWQGIKLTASKELLTDVLKGRMGFDGFVVSDWNAHDQVPGCTKHSCPAAFNAGIDMLMAPDSWKALFDNTVAQVKAGEIPMARLDDAVRRVLRVKALAGLLDKPAPSKRALAGDFKLLGAPEHRAVAREAVRKSLVLLKNNGGLLPLAPKAKVLVAGDGADDIGKQSGGWTLSWQGTGNKNSDFPGATSIHAGIRQAVEAAGGSATLSIDGSFTEKPDVAIVVFGEDPYAEFQGDLDTLEYQAGEKRDLALLRRLKAQGIPVVSVFLSGRPLWVNPEINASDAFVAASLPGSEGGGVADLLFRKPDGSIAHDFTGKLSFSWPKSASQVVLNRGDAAYDPLFAYGFGLSVKDRAELAALGEESGVPKSALANSGLYFRQGRAVSPWSLQAKDAAGAVRVTTTRQASPGGVVDVRSVDVQAQEDAKSVTWSGAGKGSILVEGRPVDLRRQSNGDMVVSLRYRLDERPTAPVLLAVGCGEGCGGSVDISGLLAPAKPGEWRDARVKLSCFAAMGADMSKVDRPVEIVTSGKLALTFTDLKLDSNTGEVACPGS